MFYNDPNKIIVYSVACKNKGNICLSGFYLTTNLTAEKDLLVPPHFSVTQIGTQNDRIVVALYLIKLDVFLTLSTTTTSSLLGRLKGVFEDNDDGIAAEEHLGDVTIAIDRLLLA